MTEATTPTIRDPQTRFDLMFTAIESRKAKLLPLLPKHLSWDVALAQFRSALMDTPDLADADQLTVYRSLERAFKLGLEPNGVLQECWLLPYREKKTGRLICQLIIGYKGWLKLAWQSGRIKQPHATVVYRQEVEAGLVQIHKEPPKIVHRIDLLADRSGWTDDDIVCSYFRMPLKGGGVVQAVLTRPELDKKERLSKTKTGWRSSDRWPNRYAGMARKAAILDAFNKREAPVSAEIEIALRNEDEIVQNADYEIIEPAPKQLPDAPKVTGSEEFTPREDPQAPDEDREPGEEPEPFGGPGECEIPF